MQEKSLIKQNILQYIDFKGISKYKFYQDSGITRGILDQNNGMSEENTTKFLACFPEVNPAWLLTGKGPMLLKSYSSLENENDISTVNEPVAFSGKKRGIPLLPIEAMAGVFKGDIQVMEYECEYIYIPMFKDAHFFMPVLGDSMYPTYNNGDIVACKKLESWSFFQIGRVYVIYTSQGAIIKRVMKGSSEDYLLIVSDNEDYPPFELPKNEILGVALVIGGVWVE
ncbi:MAG: helix-turn-helix transcriptional regulator [Flavobacteriia bacterium]|nr:helix-turn-helix transcriptional regulator [Flavobacteriia bacterium]